MQKFTKIETGIENLIVIKPNVIQNLKKVYLEDFIFKKKIHKEN